METLIRPALVRADLLDLAALEQRSWPRLGHELLERGVPTAMPWYGLFLLRQFGATTTNWTPGTQQCSLHTATYTPNQDTDDFWNDATNEVTGTAYTTKGVTLGSKAATYDTGTDEIRLDAADAVWTTATIASIRYAVVWEDTAGASTTDPVMAYFDLGAQSVTAANFTVQWDSTGIAKIDVT